MNPPRRTGGHRISRRAALKTAGLAAGWTIREWIDACRGANFAFESRVTDAVLLGNVAVRTGARLTWDHRTRTLTGAPEASQYLRAASREGWDL